MVRKTFTLTLLLTTIACFYFYGCSKKNPASSTTDGAGTISGIVTKYGDTTVIYGVAISTNPATSLTSTNADGRYTISNVSAGNYTVTASKNGYISDTASITVTANNTATANFALDTVSTTIEWIPIPAGSFTMGSLPGDPYARTDEQPQHSAYLDAYHISKYEVTNAQFKVFMDAGGYANSVFWTTEGWAWRTTNTITEPFYWSGGSYNSGVNFPDYPVGGVSWYEAYAFCQWAGGYLPTEAQWEKAARGTNPSNYWCWGSTWDASKCNCTYNTPPDTFTYSSPVGFFNTDQSPYGVYDMTGNMFEWCNDWYDSNYYNVSPDSNPLGPVSGTFRTLRLGAWDSNFNDNRCSGRGNGNPTDRHNFYGFRVAK